METHGNLLQISEAQQRAAEILSEPDISTSLLWEMCYNVTSFQTPVPLGQYRRNDNSNLRDIMLARVDTLGHYDKYPRAYDWQQLLQTLGGGEELLWVITKQAHEKKFTIYVGLKFNQEDLGSLGQLRTRKEQFQVFCDNFSRRRFPESVIERVGEGGETRELLRHLRHSNSQFAIVGMPSLKELDPEKILAERNEEVRPYASLNDILEPYINVDSAFTIIFSVSPCEASDIGDSFRDKFKLRNLLKPFIDQEFNHTEGASSGTGLNITPGHETRNDSSSPKRHIGASLWRALCGSNDKSSEDRIAEERKTPSKKRKWWDRDADVTTSLTITPEVESHSSHEDHNTSDSQTIHVTRSDLEFIDSILEQSVKHLQQAIGGNGFYTSAVVYSDDKEIGKGLAKVIRATLSGSQNYLRPMQVFPLRGEDFFQLDYNLPMADILRNAGVTLEVMNSERASIALPVPDADIPGGADTKKSVFYSKPEEVAKNQDDVENDTREADSGRSGLLLGRVAYYENQLGYRTPEEYQYIIDRRDIFSHAFISGAPGGGKSKRTAFILNHLPPDIRLIVLETAKREYGNVLKRPGKKLLRYTLGNSQKFPLRINPFFFDPGTSLKQHISIIADAMTDLLPVEALVGPKMRKAVENCYIRCDWDIETSQYCGKSIHPVYPDMLMFNCEIQKICRTFAEYGPEVRGNYTGALKNRASIFLDEIYQDIFSFDGNRTIDQLFPPDVDAVIEMEDMPPSEMNMPAFILTLLIHRLRACRFLHEGEKSGEFVTVIEEAHNVLAREIEAGANNENQSGKGKALLSLIKKTLAEGRGIGMGLIIVDQSAHAIAPSVLANTNMKIIFRQKDGEEVETIGKSIGLAEEDRQDLQFLETGECVISTVQNPKPFKLAKLSDAEMKDSEGDDDESRLVTLSEELRCPAYHLGWKFLNAWCASGLLSVSDARENAATFYRLCNSHYPMARYILGKYLLERSAGKPQLYQLLDLFLDQDTGDFHARQDFIAGILMKLMHDENADPLLAFLQNIEGNDFPELSVSEKCNAAEILRTTLKKDIKDEADKALIDDLFLHFSEAVKDKDQNKLYKWRCEFLQHPCTGNTIIFEHLYYNYVPGSKKKNNDNAKTLQQGKSDHDRS